MIVMLCNESVVDKERRGYLRAFREQGYQVICWGPPTDTHAGFKSNSSLEDLMLSSPKKPKLVLHPDGSSFLPWGITEVETPTICFQVDTHKSLDHRIRWSMLFDYVFVFQPGFAEKYKQAGHPRATLHPHAVERELFQGIARNRVYEVGWVGGVGKPPHSRRARILTRLAERFNMNDWEQRYSLDEMAEIYKRSKIVVNISRDDYPEAANLRCFEAMAGGALLLTGIPSELTKLGISEGECFLGYRDEREIEDLVRYYLDHELERQRIAEAGRELVLKEHTYDRRVGDILRMLKGDKGELFAPARSWSQEQVRQIYLDYYCNYDLLDCAFEELRRLKSISHLAAWKGVPRIAQTLRRLLRASL